MSDTVATVEQSQGINEITAGAGFYTSLQLSTRADKMAMLRAVNNSTPLLDQVGNSIKIVDVVLQAVDLANEATGVIEQTTRITLIDADGNAFHATSKGIAQALRQAFNVIGLPPTWEEPLEVGVKEEKGRNGYRFLTLTF
jgi:hypothetical protein